MKRIAVLTETQLEEIISKTVQETLLKDKEKDEKVLKRDWLTNKEVCELLSTTLKTMQNYRDKGVISFSKVGSKIYYQKSDIEAFLKSNYHPAFNKGRRLS